MKPEAELAVAVAVRRAWEDACIVLSNSSKPKALSAFEKELERAEAKVLALRAGKTEQA